MKKFSFTKCGARRYFYQVLWQFLSSRRAPLGGASRTNSGRRIFAACGGEEAPKNSERLRREL
jgi:hypothetical protein